LPSMLSLFSAIESWGGLRLEGCGEDSRVDKKMTLLGTV